MSHILTLEEIILGSILPSCGHAKNTPENSFKVIQEED